MSGHEHSRAAAIGSLYDEKIKDAWGGKISVGVEAAFFGLVEMELSYHWAHAPVVSEGVTGGMPFRRSRRDRMEWFSVYVGIGWGF